MISEQATIAEEAAAQVGKNLRKAGSLASAFFGDIDPSNRNEVELTTKQLAYMFGVTTMTLYSWRKKRKLPHHYLPGGSKPPVRFDEGMILVWASQQGIPIVNDDYKDFM
jgi:hypothetical protein